MLRQQRLLLATYLALGSGVSPAAAVDRVDRYGDPLPAGAIARLGTTRLRPGTNQVTCAYSPDGKLLATGEEDTVRLWELASGKEIRSFALPGVATVNAILFSPGGKRLAVLGTQRDKKPNQGENPRSLFVGDVQGRKEFHQFGKDGSFDSAGFLEGNMVFGRERYLVQKKGESGLAVVLWNADTGKAIRRLPTGICLCSSPDGKILAIGDTGGTIRLWDTTGRERHRLAGHRDAVCALAFSPDGRLLASGGGDSWKVPDRAAVHWDRRKGRRRDNTVRLWDVATGRQLHRLSGHRRTVPFLLFSPNGRTLLSRDAEQTLILWDPRGGQRRRCFLTAENSPRVAGFAPDGKTFVWLQSKPSGETIHEVSLATGRESRSWRGPAGATALSYSPDGKTVAVEGGRLALYDVATASDLRAQAGHRAAVTKLTYSLDGRFLATWDEAGDFHAWEAATGKQLLPVAGGPLLHASEAVFLAGSRALAVLDDERTLRVRELPSGCVLRVLRFGADAPIDFSPDNRTLVVSGTDGDEHLWDMTTGKKLCRMLCRRSVSLNFSPDGKVLAAFGSDRTLRLWRLPSGKLLRQFRSDQDRLVSLVFSADSRRLAWGGDKDSTVYLWDLMGDGEPRRLRGHQKPVWGVAFEGDGKTLVSLGHDGTLRVWDAAGREWRRRYWGDPDADPDLPIIITSYNENSPVPPALLPTAGKVVALLPPAGEGKRNTLAEAITGRTILDLGSEDFGLSPDGRILAEVSSTVTLRETATGREIVRLTGGQRGHVTFLAFSPDGRTLATGAADSTVLVWDWQELCGLKGAKGKRAPAALWAALAAMDAATAYRAIGALAADPRTAVSLLERHLRPVRAEDWEPARRLLKDLESNRFAVRQRAQRELAKLPAEWEPLLRQVLLADPPLEVRRRLEPLLEAPPMRRWSPRMVRRLRALYVLELAGTPRAKELLRRIASGIPEARLTQEARAALHRLGSRPDAVPRFLSGLRPGRHCGPLIR